MGMGLVNVPVIIPVTQVNFPDLNLIGYTFILVSGAYKGVKGFKVLFYRCLVICIFFQLFFRLIDFCCHFRRVTALIQTSCKR